MSFLFQKTLLAGVVAVLATGLFSCASDGFGGVKATRRLAVRFVGEALTGSPSEPLSLLVDTPARFQIEIEALRLDGTRDTSFSRYVRIAAKPGAVEPLAGEGTDGRNILLTAGISQTAEVSLVNAFGVTYLVADDLGYIPSDPLRTPPPACADGKDNDGDGAIDYPADEGCAFANDDAEEGGTYAEGASPPIYFRLPRIAQIRGKKCDPTRGCSGNGATPYPKQQVQVDTGYSEPLGIEDIPSFRFSTVITRLSSDGFYASDLSDAPDGFNNIFSFNFNAPPRMRVCDRLKTFGGTANEFFGFTQIAYPTWTLEEWDPNRRLCMVPEPTLLLPGIIADTTELLELSGGLVRAQTDAATRSSVRVTPKFGPGNTPCRVGAEVKVPDDYTTCDKDPLTNQFIFVPGPNETNCDFDKNGRIIFQAGTPEADCSTGCTKDAECTEYSNFLARSTFRLTVTNANGSGAVQADSSASASFDPIAMKGIEIRSFTGTLHYFSGGSQFTVEARCSDDIIVDLTQAPRRADLPCTQTAGCPEGYECLELADQTRGCRARRDDRPDLTPPPQACVFPRTSIENNPQ